MKVTGWTSRPCWISTTCSEKTEGTFVKPTEWAVVMIDSEPSWRSIIEKESGRSEFDLRSLLSQPRSKIWRRTQTLCKDTELTCGTSWDNMAMPSRSSRRWTEFGWSPSQSELHRLIRLQKTAFNFSHGEPHPKSAFLVNLVVAKFK